MQAETSIRVRPLQRFLFRRPHQYFNIPIWPLLVLAWTTPWYHGRHNAVGKDRHGQVYCLHIQVHNGETRPPASPLGGHPDQKPDGLISQHLY